MSDIDTEKAIASKFDPKSQTLIYRGRKYRYKIQDAVQWAARVKSGSYLNTPMPTLIWTLDGHTEPPLKNAALVNTLSDALHECICASGLAVPRPATCYAITREDSHALARPWSRGPRIFQLSGKCARESSAKGDEKMETQHGPNTVVMKYLMEGMSDTLTCSECKFVIVVKERF